MKLNQSYIGKSLSHGTLRHHDLLVSFLLFIEKEFNSLSKYNYIFRYLYDTWYEKYPKLFPTANKDVVIIDTDELFKYYEEVIYGKNSNQYDYEDVYEDFSEILNYVTNYLNNIAPDNSYFGTTEGDGSEFGFWAVMDDEELSVEEMFREDDDEIISNECQDPPKEITVEFESKLSDEYLLELVVIEMFHHGDFFKSLCLTYKIADGINRKILYPVIIEVMKNFGVIK